MTSVIPTPMPAAEAAGESVPIADYGLLADCNAAALVGRDGSIDWLCLPRYDSAAIFARLLDPDAGHWSIRPRGEFTVERRYLPGHARDRDDVHHADRQRAADRRAGLRRGPARPRPRPSTRRTSCCARVEGVDGEVELVLELAPRPEYGLVRPLFRQTEDGGRTFGGPNQIAVRAGVPVEVDDATMRAAFTVARRRGASASPCAGPPPEDAAPAARPAGATSPPGIADTVEAWRSWEAEHDIYEGPHRELVRLSSRVLKGLTYRPTGAIVAAPTTSLPETVGGERNWDYRYSWIRDASLTLEALYIGACSDEAEDFVSFMTSSAGGARPSTRCRSCTASAASTTSPSASSPHLRGWRDSRPVRVGNGAWNQIQLDVYGELLDALYLYREQLGELHPEIQHFVADLADTAARALAARRDSGMWEMRGEPRHHLSSKVLCWAALDRAVKLAPQLGEFARAEAWTAERDADPRRDPRARLERGRSRRTRSPSTPTSSTPRRC